MGEREGEASKFVGGRKENATLVSYVLLLTALRTYFKMPCIAKAISERSASRVRSPPISFLSLSLFPFLSSYSRVTVLLITFVTRYADFYRLASSTNMA